MTVNDCVVLLKEGFDLAKFFFFILDGLAFSKLLVCRSSKTFNASST
jgi:hypothetical protein